VRRKPDFTNYNEGRVALYIEMVTDARFELSDMAESTLRCA